MCGRGVLRGRGAQYASLFACAVNLRTHPLMTYESNTLQLRRLKGRHLSERNVVSNVSTSAPTFTNRLIAEGLGTFVLVFGGCGTALFATGDHPGTVGWLGVALAFGLTVVAGAYAFGPTSGGHFNPAITLGLFAAGKFGREDGKVVVRDIVGYIVAQIVGGAIASTALFAIAAGGGKAAALQQAGFASNGYDAGSPMGYGMASAILIEVILTAVFVFVIIGATSKISNPGFGGLAIGLTLTLIHLISIPVDNTSVNPARSIAAALYGGTMALSQLWVFIVFPIVGGVLAGLSARFVIGAKN